MNTNTNIQPTLAAIAAQKNWEKMQLEFCMINQCNTRRMSTIAPKK